MITKEFNDLMKNDFKYISIDQIEDMSNEQRAKFRKYHNPWVVWLDEISDENYTKLNELLDNNNNVNYNLMY